MAAGAALLGAGCAGDFDPGRSTPACGARPVVPPGFGRVSSEEVEADDRLGVREDFRGPQDRRLVFHLGVRPDVERALPLVEELPLATVGSGRLLGRGGEWVFAWEADFPCTEMAVVGSGFDRRSFVEALGFAQIIPFEAEAEAEGEGIEEILEEAEGEEVEGEEAGAGAANAEWVAVFDSAPDPGQLDPGAEELQDTAGTHLAISPVSCWRGLPARVGVSRNAYVAAVIAATETELDFIVERVGRIPQARGLFARRCPAD
ncbi:MAG TPA: hypothetical protein VG602_04040 [Actinomycetota bacterium]|nr:hypothetical protein [Actinomycetota bacterium]